MQKQPPDALFKKGVIRNFAKLTRKHLCWNLFFDKVKLCRPTIHYKGDFSAGFSLVNFAKFARKLFCRTPLEELLLIIVVSIVVNGELANETVNYDTKTKA